MTPVLLILALCGAPKGAADGGDGPIDFRCDAMQAFARPNRVVCRGNVVVRRADMVVCCKEFEGYAGKDGGWQRFVCSQDVRAQRGSELIWADEATFILELNNLFLTGRPMVQRGKSILQGERIVIDTRYDNARIEQPRGHMRPATEDVEKPEALPLSGPLPARCPISRARPQSP